MPIIPGEGFLIASMQYFQSSCQIDGSGPMTREKWHSLMRMTKQKKIKLPSPFVLSPHFPPCIHIFLCSSFGLLLIRPHCSMLQLQLLLLAPLLNAAPSAARLAPRFLAHPLPPIMEGQPSQAKPSIGLRGPLVAPLTRKRSPWIILLGSKGVHFLQHSMIQATRA